MSESQDQQTFKRAAFAALVGLLVQVALAIGAAVLGIYAQSEAINAATWYLFGGLPIWIVLLIIFNQHRLERLEALETEQLAQADARTAAIFDEAGQQLQLARQRLDTLYKFGLPIVSLVTALYLLVVGLVLLYSNWAVFNADQLGAMALANENANVFLIALMLALIGVIAFLVSRYVSGMTQVRDWMLLRGGAGYLMGNAVVSLLLIVGAFFAYAGVVGVLAAMAVAVPALMTVLGIEMILGFVLSIYRPRRPGEVMRPAFDSRILGWLTRPESIGKIISETLNYQFGFEISRSWFYQLLARAIVPLIVIGVVVMLGLTSIVIVPPQQQAVITTFGGNPRVATPGAHLKWPWPLGQARMHDVYRVQQLTIGSVSDPAIQNEPAIWGREHTQGGDPDYLITAPPRRGGDDAQGEAAASELIGAQLVVHYRISDLEQYIHIADEPEALLAQIATSEMSRYFSSRQTEILLSEGRRQIGEDLRRKIQAAADDVGASVGDGGLGLEVMFVGVVSIHPPHEVASDFHDYLASSYQNESRKQEARQEAIGILAEVAGSVERAGELRTAIDSYRAMQSELDAMQADPASDPVEVESLQQRVTEQEVAIEGMLDDSQGLAAQAIHAARADRWERELTELGRKERFEAQLKAFNIAPDYFRMRYYLDALAESLQGRRKIILGTDTTGVKPTIDFDLKTTEPGLGSTFQTE